MPTSNPDRNGGAARTRPALDRQIHDALGDLHACVLVLDIEQRRLVSRLEALPRPGVVPPERAELEQRHAELTEELAALQAMIQRLRVSVDPEAEFL